MSIFACRWLIVYHPGWNHINKCISITRPWQQLLNPLSLCMFPGILSELILQSADVHGIILNEDKEVVQWGFLTFFFFKCFKNCSDAFPLVCGRKWMQIPEATECYVTKFKIFIKQLFFFSLKKIQHKFWLRNFPWSYCCSLMVALF